MHATIRQQWNTSALFRFILAYVSILAFGAATFMCGGCGTFDAARGFEKVQRGLAVVDVATDKASRAYVESMRAVTRFCEAQPDPDACFDRLGFSEADMSRVCVPGKDGEAPCVDGAAADIDEAYRRMVEGLTQAEQAWAVIQSELDAAKDAADAVAE